MNPEIAESPARNRVTPLGDIVAIPLRGAWTGNRGILHSGREIVRFHTSDLWVTCTHRRHVHDLPWADLPDGTFVLLGESPAVVVGDGLTEWTREGYGAHRARPARGTAQVITPPSTVASLRAGCPVQIDGGARE